MTPDPSRLPETGIVVEGSFELPPLAQLSVDDQVFVAAFVKSHGSIKEMELALNAELSVEAAPPASDKSAILDRLERGEITAEQAAEALRS